MIEGEYGGGIECYRFKRSAQSAYQKADVAGYFPQTEEQTQKKKLEGIPGAGMTYSIDKIADGGFVVWNPDGDIALACTDLDEALSYIRYKITGSKLTPNLPPNFGAINWVPDGSNR